MENNPEITSYPSFLWAGGDAVEWAAILNSQPQLAAVGFEDDQALS